MVFTLSVLLGAVSLLVGIAANFNATNVDDWSLDLAEGSLDVGDDRRPLLPMSDCSRPMWPPPVEFDRTTLNLVGLSACFICAWRCCGLAMRRGGMLSVSVVLGVLTAVEVCCI